MGVLQVQMNWLCHAVQYGAVLIEAPRGVPSVLRSQKVKVPNVKRADEASAAEAFSTPKTGFRSTASSIMAQDILDARDSLQGLPMLPQQLLDERR